MAVEPARFLAPQAWVQGTWAKDVLLEAGTDGQWSRITPHAADTDIADAVRLSGPVLPGLVNAHSHAFQRGIAGLTERSGGQADNFWSWRDRMYRMANRITPDQLEAIAAFLYAELLRSGYTQVCEFHYVHNGIGGAPADPLEMSMALVRAARRVGIGLTLLPTLYMRSGFGAAGLRDDQQRFASTPASVLRIAREVRALNDPLLHAGVALHSLRAVGEPALREVAEQLGADMPLHIHVAEQQQEVDDCVLHLGLRPIDWLVRHTPVDARWNLVHATQARADELDALRHRGASIVICPSTDANLGDGVFELPAWMGQRGSWSLGSDSHVTRSWTEELRLLEYSQRLLRRQRNVAAQAAVCDASAAALFEGALQGGTAGAGRPLGGLAVGQRADFMVIDTAAPALAGVPADHMLDALVFSSPEAAPSSVYVAGRRARAPDAGITQAYVRALQG